MCGSESGASVHSIGFLDLLGLRVALGLHLVILVLYIQLKWCHQPKNICAKITPTTLSLSENLQSA